MEGRHRAVPSRHVSWRTSQVRGRRTREAIVGRVDDGFAVGSASPGMRDTGFGVGTPDVDHTDLSSAEFGGRRSVKRGRAGRRSVRRGQAGRRSVRRGRAGPPDGRRRLWSWTGGALLWSFLGANVRPYSTDTTGRHGIVV